VLHVPDLSSVSKIPPKKSRKALRSDRPSSWNDVCVCVFVKGGKGAIGVRVDWEIVYEENQGYEKRRERRRDR
jgi:hypothetical protein